MSKEFAIITFNRSKRNRKILKVTYIFGAILIPFLMMSLWVYLLPILLITFILLAPFFELSINSFKKIGNVKFRDDKVIFGLDSGMKEIKLSELKGVNIEAQLKNPFIVQAVNNIRFNHRGYVYKLTFVKSRYDKLCITIFNYEDYKKKLHPRHKEGFMDILRLHSKTHNIRLWDKTGGKSAII